MAQLEKIDKWLIMSCCFDEQEYFASYLMKEGCYHIVSWTKDKRGLFLDKIYPLSDDLISSLNKYKFYTKDMFEFPKNEYSCSMILYTGQHIPDDALCIFYDGFYRTYSLYSKKVAKVLADRDKKCSIVFYIEKIRDQSGEDMQLIKQWLGQE